MTHLARIQILDQMSIGENSIPVVDLAVPVEMEGFRGNAYETLQAKELTTVCIYGATIVTLVGHAIHLGDKNGLTRKDLIELLGLDRLEF